MSGSTSPHLISDAPDLPIASDALSIETISSVEWHALLGKFRDASYRQCGSYIEETARPIGAKVELVRITEGDRLIGLAAIRIKTVPLTSWGIAYANYAPLVMGNGASFEQNFRGCINALCKEYVEKRRLVFRVTPPPRGGLVQRVQASSLAAGGFRPGLHRARTTFVLDLKLPLEEMRRRLDVKWRHSLMRSEKADLRITRGFYTASGCAFLYASPIACS